VRGGGAGIVRLPIALPSHTPRHGIDPGWEALPQLAFSASTCTTLDQSGAGEQRRVGELHGIRIGHDSLTYETGPAGRRCTYGSGSGEDCQSHNQDWPSQRLEDGQSLAAVAGRRVCTESGGLRHASCGRWFLSCLTETAFGCILEAFMKRVRGAPARRDARGLCRVGPGGWLLGSGIG
jgi:hypothetical protein